MNEDIKKIKKIARTYKYKFLVHDKDCLMLSFANKDIKDRIRINVYYTTMTVGTCLKHPKKGRTQLFRRRVSMKQLEKIFENPRQHTGKGYYTKY